MLFVFFAINLLQIYIDSHSGLYFQIAHIYVELALIVLDFDGLLYEAFISDLMDIALVSTGLGNTVLLLLGSCKTEFVTTAS